MKSTVQTWSPRQPLVFSPDETDKSQWSCTFYSNHDDSYDNNKDNNINCNPFIFFISYFRKGAVGTARLSSRETIGRQRIRTCNFHIQAPDVSSIIYSLFDNTRKQTTETSCCALATMAEFMWLIYSVSCEGNWEIVLFKYPSNCKPCWAHRKGLIV